MTTIPSLDLTQQYQTIQGEVEAAVLRILASGSYIGGEAVASFEQQFAQYIGTQEAVSCNSGTDALYLALRALEIGPGDEVITTPFTFFATAETISMVGAKPVFVDIEAEGFNIDLDQIEGAITPRTRAIMPVHLFGRPVNMARLGRSPRPTASTSSKMRPRPLEPPGRGARSAVGARSAASAFSPPKTWEPVAMAAAPPPTIRPWPKKCGCCASTGCASATSTKPWA
ncbi:MAG: aminotransferase class I/II-fold pyridoxal phosphate-dependent enzyme [Synechococcales cyanobacterium RM1_1_8]|nr:aminotransferase class I/II-fold pyridoxal phosphate-dependent enzyme [Synechococcales cyanobacterium RM1_1_8]